MPFEQGEAIPFVQPDQPVRVSYLANADSGAPVKETLQKPLQLGAEQLQ